MAWEIDYQSQGKILRFFIFPIFQHLMSSNLLIDNTLIRKKQTIITDLPLSIRNIPLYELDTLYNKHFMCPKN